MKVDLSEEERLESCLFGNIICLLILNITLFSIYFPEVLYGLFSIFCCWLIYMVYQVNKSIRNTNLKLHIFSEMWGGLLVLGGLTLDLFKNRKQVFKSFSEMVRIPFKNQEVETREVNFTDIGLIVKSARKSKKQTQETVAYKAGISVRTLSRLEIGKNISFENLRAICDFLEIPVPINHIIIEKKDHPVTSNSFKDFLYEYFLLRSNSKKMILSYWFLVILISLAPLASHIYYPTSMPEWLSYLDVENSKKVREYTTKNELITAIWKAIFIGWTIHSLFKINISRYRFLGLPFSYRLSTRIIVYFFIFIGWSSSIGGDNVLLMRTWMNFQWSNTNFISHFSQDELTKKSNEDIRKALIPALTELNQAPSSKGYPEMIKHRIYLLKP